MVDSLSTSTSGDVSSDITDLAPAVEFDDSIDDNIEKQVDSSRQFARDSYNNAIQKINDLGGSKLNVNIPDNVDAIVDTTIPSYSELYSDIASKLNFVEFPEIEDDFPDPSQVNIDLQKPEGIKNISENVPDTSFVVSTDPDLSDLMWYKSDMFNALENQIKEKLYSFLQGNSTGISPEVEQAIYNRSKNRLNDEIESQYRQAENYFAARGFPMPPGALAGRLQEIDREHGKRLEELNYDILTKQAELEQSNRWKSFDMALQYGQFDFDRQSGRSQFNLNKKQQKLAKMDTEVRRESAKVDAKLRAFSTEYQTLIETYRGEVDYERARVQTVLEKMNSQVNITASKTDAIARRVEAINANNANIAQAYKASYDAATAKLDGYLNKYNTEVQAEMQRLDLKFREEAEELRIKSDSNNQASQLASQLAASALSALNVSTSIGYNESKGLSHSTNLSQSESHSVSRSDQYILQG